MLLLGCFLTVSLWRAVEIAFSRMRSECIWSLSAKLASHRPTTNVSLFISSCSSIAIVFGKAVESCNEGIDRLTFLLARVKLGPLEDRVASLDEVCLELLSDSVILLLLLLR